MEAVVFGNATLDVLCYPVGDVPRYESIPFERAVVSPGGCGSNVAVGLCALGVPTALVARIGTDDAALLVERYWARVGLDTHFVRRLADRPTAVSVGLVDGDAQPRFVHTPGANAALTVDALDVSGLAATGARFLHVGGFLVLPAVSSERLAEKLEGARGSGLLTSLDVAVSRNECQSSDLWPCLPHVDFLFCNAREARYLTGDSDPAVAARSLHARGARAVIVKLGAEGCLVEGDGLSERVPGLHADVVDTTGAGDAFAAGFIASMLKDGDVIKACQAGNAAGAHVVGLLGAVAAWFQQCAPIPYGKGERESPMTEVLG